VNNKKQIVSKRLSEVWEWKGAIYREVADLPPEQALKKLLKKARRLTEKYKFQRYSPARTNAVGKGNSKQISHK